MRKRLLRLLERKHTVDDRLHLVHRNRPVHFLEHLAIADEDAMQITGFVHQWKWTRIAITASDEADQADFAAASQRLHRPGERSTAADFNHAVYSAAADAQHLFLPFRRARVVDTA